MSTNHSWRKIISTTQDSGYHPSSTGQHLSSVPGKQFLLVVHIIRKNMKIRKKAKKTNPGAICSSSLENIQKLNFNIGKKSWCVYKNNALIRSNLPKQNGFFSCYESRKKDRVYFQSSGKWRTSCQKTHFIVSYLLFCHLGKSNDVSLPWKKRFWWVSEVIMCFYLDI